MKTRILQKFSLVFLVFYISSSSYSQMLKVELEEISTNSHSIIRGIVSNKWSEFEENGRDIITIIEFNAIETIKGTTRSSEQVIIPGGAVGEIEMMVSHTPHFYLGQEVIVFITNDYKGRPTINEWIQGKFQIINKRIIYENNEILAENFILGLKNFMQKGEQGKIEIKIINFLSYK
ncbi:MAG: hypothetical protein K9H48_08415 [Melioribacteraceae bacterium]|nr:hypothetical protein [Melioribacteraceae bacterium]MCF8394072.1 hypothetical protein [Melioribacteraceae bacterium]MCF8419838.1 hypothetical protein [Melioribacteraceae bacterium]